MILLQITYAGKQISLEKSLENLKRISLDFTLGCLDIFYFTSCTCSLNASLIFNKAIIIIKKLKAP